MFNYNRIVCMNNEYVQKFNYLKLKICQFGSVLCRTYWQAFNTLPLSALYIPSCIICLTQNIFLINTSTQVCLGKLNSPHPLPLSMERRLVKRGN